MINHELIKPLPEKEIVFDAWYAAKHPDRLPMMKRVLFFDPTPLYERVKDKINPNKRHQGIQMEDIFPKQDVPVCACGCGKPTDHGANKDGSKLWHRKWAHDNCQRFANDVLSIMNNYFGKPAYYVSLYWGEKCCQCPNTTMLELDHIVRVKHGGGACWLSNYRWLCKDCHNKKTNQDFGKGEFNSKKPKRKK